MNVVIFGATGMVGQGVLRECLRDPGVEQVLTIGRRVTGEAHPKLREVLLPNALDYTSVEASLSGYDACFFCLGVSSIGMNETDYRRVTVDYTVAAANAVLKHSPGLVFVFVSGSGTDSTERGRVMWARVKGEAENALLRMPFKGTYLFRPAYIQPMHGIKSKTRAYRVGYAVMKPLYPILKALFPTHLTTTEHLGRAMLAVAKQGFPQSVLESRDIEALGARRAG